MATVAALPSTLRDKLAALKSRIRLLRAVRGFSLVALVVLVLGGSALAADHFLTLPLPALQVILGALAAVAVGTILFGVIVPLCRRIDPEALAALIEEKHPELSERLTSTVELAGDPDIYHGSAELIALLVRETETQTHALDFTRAFPARTTGQLALAAGFALLLAAVPGVLWPERYAELGQRLFLSWIPGDSAAASATDGPAPGSYTVVAPRGNLFELKGRPLMLLASFRPDRKTVVLPDSCTLVCTDAQETVSRYPMSAQDPSTFFYKLDRVAGDFRYFIEAGDKRSDTYQVTAVDSTITIDPPAYVNEKSLPKQAFHVLTDASALQYSRTTYAIRQSRPATRAVFRWQAKNSKGARELPLALAPDGRSAHIDLPALQPGVYACSLVLEDASRRPSVLSLNPLTVWSDELPIFGEVSWKEDPKVSTIVETDARGQVSLPAKTPAADPIRYVPEDQTVPLELRVADKVGLGEAGIEYRLMDDSTIHFDPILDGKGLPDAAAKHVFSLAGKVKPGGTILYRIRVADNRKVLKGTFRDADGRAVPAHNLDANVIYHPRKLTRDRWFTLTVNPRAKRLQQQEIELARRLRQEEVEADARSIDEQLQEIQKKLEQEQQNVKILRGGSLSRTQLTPEQAKDLGRIQGDNRAARSDLHDLAAKAEDKPALQALADKVRAVADQELQESQNALQRAANPKAEMDPRNEHLQKSDEQLAKAIQQLEALRRESRQLAEAALDQMKLEAVADRQKELAKEAAQLAAKDAVKDKTTQSQLQRLQREQNDLANELQRLANDSKPLKNALDALRAEEARALAKEARALAKDQRANQPERNEGTLAELARKQQELADKAAKLAEDTRQPALATRTPPLRPEETAKAAQALKQGDAAEALARQDAAARELDRAAHDLDRAQERAKDPRETARQLARVQEDLHRRLQQEINKRGNPADRQQRLQPLVSEQEAIQRAAAALALPRNRREAQADQKTAVNQAARAADALKRQQPYQAAALMNQTRDALNRLANRLPTAQQAREQVNEVRRQQDETARLAAEALRQAQKKDANNKQAQEELARRLAEAARRQAEAAERLSKIDMPRQHEERHERTQKALDKALADLMDGRKPDIAASQEEAKRQLERLQQALSGQKPADEKAAELAKRQKDLADEARKLAANARSTPQDRQDLQRRQQQLARETQNLPATEARKQQAEALQATRKAEQAANAQPTSAESQKQMKQAAQALEGLARQLEGKTDAKAADQSPRRLAQEMARRQQELARATQEAENQAKRRPADQAKEALQKALERVAQQQRELNQKASQLPADQAQRALESARRAMNQAEQALARNNGSESRQKQQEAARALQALARQVPNETRSSARRPAPNDRQADAKGLPSKAQADEARQLAQNQRDLRAEVQKTLAKAQPASPAQNNTPAELARQQQEIARRTGDLAKGVAQKQGSETKPAQKAKQAAQATDQAAKQVQSGAMKDAQQSGRQAADQLRDLARQLAQASQGGATKQADQAKQLAEQQDALNRRMQEAQQANLQKETDNLAGRMNRLAQDTGRTPAAQQKAQQAVWSTQQAKHNMQQSQHQDRQGNKGQASESSRQAAEQLEQAAHHADQAAQELAKSSSGSKPKDGGSKSSSGQKTGQKVQEAQGEMHQAQDKLGQGKTQSAGKSMQQAATTLKQAAEQMAKQSQPSTPNENRIPGKLGASPDGRPDLKKLDAEKAMYDGKAWGQLPGELRTKILQDMKAKYGDDYARIIKLYFERIADTRGEKKK
jgi:hypothetical protein